MLTKPGVFRPHKVNFLSASWSIFSELLDLRNQINQYSACNRSVYTTCTQWLHHHYFACLDAQVPAFGSLVPEKNRKITCMASHKSSETFGSKPQSQVAAVRVSTSNMITKPPSHLLKFSAKFWYVRPNLNTQSLVTKQQTANYNTYVNNEEA